MKNEKELIPDNLTEDSFGGDFQEVIQAFSFPVEAMDKILYQLGLIPGHLMMKSDLKNSILSPHTSGTDLDNQYDTALKVLEAFDLIVINGNAISVGKGGFRLFEILDEPEVRKPYTTFINRKKIEIQNEQDLLKYQIEVSRQQTVLNPLIEASNRASEKIQRRLLSINFWIAIAGLVAAVYYIFGLFDFYQDHSPNWQYVAYFLTGLGIGLLPWLLSMLRKK